MVISALRGDFEKQLAVHKIITDDLAMHNGKIIYISTVNVFDGECSVPHYENDKRILNSDYGRFKIYCEDLLRIRMDDQAVLVSSHEAGLQIAEYIEWIIQEDKSGTFHVGTTDTLKQSYTKKFEKAFCSCLEVLKCVRL